VNNKPLTAKTVRGGELPWVRDADWRVVYAPDFKILDTEQAGSYRLVGDSAYRMVLDVTDLVARGQKNDLSLAHLGEAAGRRLDGRALGAASWGLCMGRGVLGGAARCGRPRAGRGRIHRPAGSPAARRRARWSPARTRVFLDRGPVGMARPLGLGARPL